MVGDQLFAVMPRSLPFSLYLCRLVACASKSDLFVKPSQSVITWNERSCLCSRQILQLPSPSALKTGVYDVTSGVNRLYI